MTIQCDINARHVNQVNTILLLVLLLVWIVEWVQAQVELLVNLGVPRALQDLHLLVLMVRALVQHVQSVTQTMVKKWLLNVAALLTLYVNARLVTSNLTMAGVQYVRPVHILTLTTPLHVHSAFLEEHTRTGQVLQAVKRAQRVIAAQKM
jgi:hypothetical protein